MEFKGTKGKWEFRKTSALNENGKPLFYDICIEDQSFISTFRNESIGNTDETQLANAKLISCAPEMLSVLLTLSNIVKCDMPKWIKDEIEYLINKATTI